jgi:hypothetical protein
VWDIDLDTIDVPSTGAHLDYRYHGNRVQGRVAGYGRSRPQGDVEFIGQSDNYGTIHVAAELVQGAYKVFLPRGSYHMECGLHAPFAMLSTQHDIQVSADTTIEVGVYWERATGSIRIRGRAASWKVFLTGNASLPDTMYVNGSFATDSQGRYLGYLPAANYTGLVQSAPKGPCVFPRWFSRSVPGSDQTDIPAVLWSGTVRDSATGTLLDSVFVSASNRIGNVLTPVDRSGQFRMLVEAGQGYMVTVSDGYRHPHEHGYRFPNFGTTSDSIFDLVVPSIRR